MRTISIIIPAFNEELKIEKTLSEILAYVNNEKITCEIIVVNDGSTDKTGKILDTLKNDNVTIVKNSINKGKGFSVKSGALKAEGDLILFTDADLSTPITELKKLAEYSLNYDVIIGSRALKKSEILIRQPLYRELGGKIINFLARVSILPRIYDTQCGFKLFTKKAATEIFSRQTINGWGFDIELLFIARKLGFKIKEVPISWEHEKNSKIKPFHAGLRLLGDIVKIKLNNLKGRYN